jgi:hypothetical protein
MANVARTASAWLASLIAFGTGCAWSDAQPTLLLQLSQVVRGRAAPDAITRTRELVFSAAVSMALERTALLVDAAGLPTDRTQPDPQTSFIDDINVAPSSSQSRSNLPPPEPLSEAIRGEQRTSSALCEWAQAAEETAFQSAVERAELAP